MSSRRGSVSRLVTNEHDGWLSTRNKKKISPPSCKPSKACLPMRRSAACSPKLMLMDDGPCVVNVPTKQTTIADFFGQCIKPLKSQDCIEADKVTPSCSEEQPSSGNRLTEPGVEANDFVDFKVLPTPSGSECQGEISQSHSCCPEAASRLEPSLCFPTTVSPVENGSGSCELLTEGGTTQLSPVFGGRAKVCFPYSPRSVLKNMNDQKTAYGFVVERAGYNDTHLGKENKSGCVYTKPRFETKPCTELEHKPGSKLKVMAVGDMVERGLMPDGFLATGFEECRTSISNDDQISTENRVEISVKTNCPTHQPEEVRELVADTSVTGTQLFEDSLQTPAFLRVTKRSFSSDDDTDMEDGEEIRMNSKLAKLHANPDTQSHSTSVKAGGVKQLASVSPNMRRLPQCFPEENHSGTTVRPNGMCRENQAQSITEDGLHTPNFLKESYTNSESEDLRF